MSTQLLPFGKKGWDYGRVPDLAGRHFAITGGNVGIGFETAKMLLQRNARVTIFCRSEERTRKAVDELSDFRSVKARIEYELMDLANMESVRNAAERFVGFHEKLDGLINNTSIVMVPERVETPEGFELQMGANHFGHFLFSALLFDLIKKGNGRIVTVSSVAYRWGAERIDFDNLHFEENYSPLAAFAQSKLANIMFTLELNRRLLAKEMPASGYLCHPGYAGTNAQRTGSGFFTRVGLEVMNVMFAHSPFHGAKSQVLALTDPEAKPGLFYGPTKMKGLSGPVGVTPISHAAGDAEAAARLWDISEKLTGVDWRLPPA
ncbi:SDR family NAD(P)-dependent oxidoreductase [Maritalea mediterranea]|uniref:SDR family NAD(P)-dependent oxidoreductase n=1 Tax=Maritalea mediterranea TaxID=2909667 RepID=A0ABS9ECC7_9HYPH|nr:SDR family NAD(P)-dependent oxidoreductase [Maritalea mediterranea]MCF4099539.1 SDR family NAD(P)-dependent oxidoreductase [Maritalea mediterranea]